MRGALVLVFVLGAATMGFEILGPRMMAPHFGTTPNVWGAVISVFLGGLALGYALGGRLGDRGDRAVWASGVWAVTGLLVLASHAAAKPVGDAFVTRFAQSPPWWEPVAAASTLFLVPTVGMGTAIPLLLRLGGRRGAGEGEHAGRYMAWSTLGGILGVLGTTFWLFGLFTLQKIAWILATPWLVAAGLAALEARRE